MTYLNLVILFVPLIFLLWLAQMADKQRSEDKRGLAIVVHLLLGMMWGLLALIGVLLLLMGIAYTRYADTASLSTLYHAQGMEPEEVIHVMHLLPKIGLGLVLLALAGLTLLLPPVRRLLARAMPHDPNSATVAVTWAFSVLILVNMWLITGIGMETASQALTNAPDVAPIQMILQLWLQNGLMALMALVGVGWLSRRSWPQVRQRLGLVWPGWRKIMLGIYLGLGAFVLLFPLMLLLEKLGLDTDPNVDALTQKLIGPLLDSMFGIITLGAAAALGEELTFRGALQPRFGIVFTAAIFALTHNQYGISVATLVVFLLGLALGWTRKRTNTTTTFFFHAIYNIAIGLIGHFVH